MVDLGLLLLLKLGSCLVVHGLDAIRCLERCWPGIGVQAAAGGVAQVGWAQLGCCICSLEGSSRQSTLSLWNRHQERAGSSNQISDGMTILVHPTQASL